ncbi:MAG TPA: NAD(P)-dependent oxidoreductase [Galbitalea sp.]|jgi:3-hydroxyisobutyrate dehydrogenase-like beta-hydroxyacid dehydrogenase|nr:NAD(P)-dependent oxidoreductase [Galbitalea sp.]
MDNELPVLGLIGLGTMGTPIAERLIGAGAELWVFDTDVAAVNRAVGNGASAAASPSDVAAHADVVLLSLPNAKIVLEVVAGKDGLLSGSPVRAVIDLSTTGPAGAENLRTALEASGVSYLDAPVSGGPAGARGGRLTIMAAGAPELLAELTPILSILGSNILHVGDVGGQGQLAKVLNNLMSATSIAITAEALSMGVRGGLDPERLLSVINASSGRNAASSDKFPQFVLTRSFDFGFQYNLMVKDVSLALDEAARVGVPMMVGSTVRQLWDIGQKILPSGSDCTALAQVVESWAGVTIGGDA